MIEGGAGRETKTLSDLPDRRRNAMTIGKAPDEIENLSLARGQLSHPPTSIPLV
jgi:hypothetical protein